MENNRKRVSISVVHGDATEYETDVLVLKYAQAHFGLDRTVSNKLIRLGVEENEFAPEPGESNFFHSRGGVKAKSVLVVGVTRLSEFSYKDIRICARAALEALSEHEKDGAIEHVCFTMHGVQYGLDEIEAFESEIAGLIDGITACRIPKSIEGISIIEIDDRRAKSLGRALSELIPLGYIETNLKIYHETSAKYVHEKLRSVGYLSDDKPHMFVAMPFREELEDIYEYGIQNAVRKAGFICERADLSAFTGDVVDWVKKRIRSASMLIADLTGANPNVYLELGYAWGVGVKTVLLTQEAEQLKFDVRGQRCLVYKRIEDLEEKLYKELVALKDEIIN
ncbi:MAG: M17 family peptidase N-terminal domain-containing protein [Rhodospirillales bacterium]